MQVIFIVFARIKLQLQILTRYLVSASSWVGWVIAEKDSLNLSCRHRANGWWLVGSIEHSLALPGLGMNIQNTQTVTASRPVIICMQQTANGGTGAGQTPRGVMEVRISD